MEAAEAVRVNRVFHDHECAYYDERFAIVHDARSARQARAEVERLLGRALRPGEIVLDPGCGTGWQAAGLRRAAAPGRPPARLRSAGTGPGAGSATGSVTGSATGSATRSVTGSATRSVTGSVTGSATRSATGPVTGPEHVDGGPDPAAAAGFGPAAGPATGSAVGPAAPAGSGSGGGAVIGVDLSAGMLERARAAGAWPLLQADAARLPLAAGSVDLVVSRGVLHHLPDVPAALAEWRRVLRPGGAVVVASEPTPAVDRHAAPLVRALLAALRRPLTEAEDFWEVASMAANLHVFTPAELARTARAAGFAEAALTTADLLSTLVLTASYVTHGRRRDLARRVPWRGLESAGRWLDRLVVERVLAERFRHTVVGVLRA
jgi:ubiquinone/menaquinone biosynthesis C-methylase UbiE